MAGFIILCVIAIVMCVYFLTENDPISETQSTTTINEAFDFDLPPTTSSEKIPTTTTTTSATTRITTTTERPEGLDMILNPF